MGLAQELGRTRLSTYLESFPCTRQTHRAPFTLLGAPGSCHVRGPPLPPISDQFPPVGEESAGRGKQRAPGWLSL
uniref:Uncharacterized protein n=1 Tax=Mustela putorius furo TaxID=9669 RepID=M3XNP6_MUSPF